MEAPTYALQRKGDKTPTELVPGTDYQITLGDGSESFMTLYAMLVLAHQLEGSVDHVGPVVDEQAPEGSWPVGGWGTVEEAVWDGSAFVRPLSGSEPLAEPTPEELVDMVRKCNQAELFRRVQQDNPDHYITADAVSAVLDAQNEKIDMLAGAASKATR